MCSRYTGRRGDYRYMQGMLRELKSMAASNRADMLAYLIEMAYLECSDILRGSRPERETTKDFRLPLD